MKRHVNIPIFIPHLGCPNACVFCNQRRISGRSDFDITSVEDEIKRALSTVKREECEVEIAFFGGSFTGIDRADMIYLLSAAKRHIDSGEVDSVRLSTRPDYIDSEILDILSEYGVTDIELGLQSMCDHVLFASGRGHDAGCAREACRLIRSRGFGLVGQMMIGLPGSSPEDELYTAREIISLGCTGARIYPTLVFAETDLAEMTADGRYTPLTLDGAVKRSADVLSVFAGAGLPVLRIGLCSSDNLFEPGSVVGGEYHSALGEMVYSELYYRRIKERIAALGAEDPLAGSTLTVYVPRGEVSKASGQCRENKKRLMSEYGLKKIRIIEDESLDLYSIALEYR